VFGWLVGLSFLSFFQIDMEHSLDNTCSFLFNATLEGGTRSMSVPLREFVLGGVRLIRNVVAFIEINRGTRNRLAMCCFSIVYLVAKMQLGQNVQ
jgi:hypothetical protein